MNRKERRRRARLQKKAEEKLKKQTSPRGEPHDERQPSVKASPAQPEKHSTLYMRLRENCGSNSSPADRRRVLSELHPKLSVDVSGSLQPYNPLGTVFYLSNDGLLPVHNIIVTCGNFNVRGPSFQIIGPNEFTFPDSHAEVLSPGDKMTLPCAHAVGFTAPVNFTEAEMIITAHYQPDFLWWRKTEPFPWKAERTQKGEWIWKSIPDSRSLVGWSHPESVRGLFEAPQPDKGSPVANIWLRARNSGM